MEVRRTGERLMIIFLRANLKRWVFMVKEGKHFAYDYMGEIRLSPASKNKRT
jgi:hypothetical protein